MLGVRGDLHISHDALFSVFSVFLLLHTIYRKKKKKHDLQQYRTNKYK